MTALDIIVLLLVAAGAWRGYRNGFVHEMLSLAAWVAGIVAVKAGHAATTDALLGYVGTRTGAAALAFALCFGLAFGLTKLLAARLGGATRRSAVAPVDRVLGGGFGLLKGLIGATLLFLLANLVGDTMYGAGAERPGWLRAARTFPLLDATGRALVDLVDRRRRPVSDAEANG